ncbi:hypothetical protein FS837_007042, partial [Tulasnella sp. UAMH 9824]
GGGGDADKDEETAESQSDEEPDGEEPQPTRFPKIANGGENKVEDDGGPIEAKDLLATISRLLSANRPEATDDAELSNEESDSDGDVEQQHSQKSPSSDSGLRSGSDEEGVDGESEWGGIAGKDSDSDSDSELEGSD